MRSPRHTDAVITSRVPKIVIVEDHDDLRAALDEMLTHAGWQVRVYADVEEALTAIRALAPDVVLTDINVGELSGRALARALRIDSATAGIPVVAMSGSIVPTPGVLRHFTLFLSKPVDLTKLDEILREVLAKARMRALASGG